MGLGKTLQAIAACHWLMKNEKVKRVLVVCPASLKQQWSREIERFIGIKSQIIQGNAKERAAQYQCQNPFSIINYELVVRDKATITRSLAPDVLVIDEAQRIRNWRTKTAEAIKSVHSHYAFVLTGTPLENRLEDLYSVMQVVDHEVLGPLWRYLIDFHVTDDRGRVLGYRNLSELRTRLGHLMLRRDRRLVKDQLPDRIEHRRDVELSKKQRQYHDQAVASIGMYADIRRRRALTPAEHKRLLAAIQNARMACNAAGLIDKESHGSPKLDELKRLLEEVCLESGQKVVVFSEWERMTAMAEKITKSLGIDCVRLYGRVPSKDRGKLIEKFQNNPAVKVFISTDAGGVGLNLQAGSVLINLDVPWNPAVLAQRIARVHRLGQKATVQIIHLYSIDSYEERVAAVMNKKRELFENVIDIDADKDVVGISKKMTDSLLDDVLEIDSKNDPETTQEPITESVPEAKPQRAENDSQTSIDITESEDDELSPYIEKIQRGLGSRLQQILRVGDKLIAVVDRMDHRAEKLSNSPQDGALSILVVDQATASTLDKMGEDSPFGEKEELFEKAPRRSPKRRRAPALIAAANRQIKAATMLIESERSQESLHFIAEALLMSCAYKLGYSKAPKVEQGALWIYDKVAKNIDDESKLQIARALALLSVESIPDKLIGELLDDAKQFIDRAESAPKLCMAKANEID
ncbi:MAG: DEAD/DEAH box helicase, partial [Planctomycetota bacterium]|nr:DEAD/DEAH box helicase [Planctomycetota bacterium]